MSNRPMTQQPYIYICQDILCNRRHIIVIELQNCIKHCAIRIEILTMKLVMESKQEVTVN